MGEGASGLLLLLWSKNVKYINNNRKWRKEKQYGRYWGTGLHQHPVSSAFYQHHLVGAAGHTLRKMDEAKSGGANEAAAYSGDDCDRFSGKQFLFGLPVPVAAIANDVVAGSWSRIKWEIGS